MLPLSPFVHDGAARSLVKTCHDSCGSRMTARTRRIGCPVLPITRACRLSPFALRLLTLRLRRRADRRRSRAARLRFVRDVRTLSLNHHFANVRRPSDMQQFPVSNDTSAAHKQPDGVLPDRRVHARNSAHPARTAIVVSVQLVTHQRIARSIPHRQAHRLAGRPPSAAAVPSTDPSCPC